MWILQIVMVFNMTIVFQNHFVKDTFVSISECFIHMTSYSMTHFHQSAIENRVLIENTEMVSISKIGYFRNKPAWPEFRVFAYKTKTAWSGLEWIDMNVNGLWVGIVPTNTPNGLVLLNYSVGPINMSGRDGKYGILSVLTRFRVMKFAFCINKGGHLRSLLYFLPSQRFPMIIN